jgi:hypothetical protein
MLRCALAAILLAPALLAQGPAPASPQAATQPVDPPRLAITPNGRVKLGSLGPRERKVLTYSFQNTSAAPIALRVGDLSPGVIVFGPALDRPIQPRESAALTMTIDPTDFVGVQRRSVRLLTDDPRQGQYFLPVEMTVRPDLTVDQERKSFGEIAAHESPQLHFTFKRETADPLQVRVTSPLPDYLELETIPSAGAVDLQLTFRPQRVAPGVRLGLETLQVETNAPHQPRFTLYLDWKLSHPVVATPTRIVFLNPADKTLALNLKRRDGKPFALESATVEGEGFAIVALPKGEALAHSLRIRNLATRETKAILALRFEGQEEALKVPLAYLPASDQTAPK